MSITIFKLTTGEVIIGKLINLEVTNAYTNTKVYNIECPCYIDNDGNVHEWMWYMYFSEPVPICTNYVMFYHAVSQPSPLIDAWKDTHSLYLHRNR